MPNEILGAIHAPVESFAMQSGFAPSQTSVNVAPPSCDS